MTLSDDGQQYYLCINESFPGFNQSEEVPSLNTEEGTPTEYTQGVLKYLGEYQAEFELTQGICKKIKDFNLLEVKQVEVTFPNAEAMTIDSLFGAS